MKHLGIKYGALKIGEPKSTTFSLDNWLFGTLERYGLTPTRSCCGKFHINLISGIDRVSNEDDSKYFDMDKWLRKNLVYLGILTTNQSERLCCPTKNRLFLSGQHLYFGDNSARSKNLFKWLKKNLTEWAVSPTLEDPCCLP